ERLAQARQLGVAPHRRGRRTRVPRGSGLQQPPCAHRPSATLDGERPALLEQEPPLEQARGAVADQHGSRLGGALQAGRHVGRVAERHGLRRSHSDGPNCRRPELMPTRTLKRSIPHAARMSSEYEPTISTIRSAARAARSGSSACAAGTPKYAQMPSPWYAWIVPPNSSTAPLTRVTHSPTSAFTSSGSRRSPSAVEPTMSAKSAVTGLTSSSTPPSSRSRARL